jgi:LmbE family N-acetylglucosaminyl deacetylase
MIVLSPHLDDAVLSFGESLTLDWAEPIKIVTVFAGLPPDPEVLTHYDAKCGFKTARQAREVRISEDRRALAVLGMDQPEWWGFVDHQYGVKPNSDDIAALFRPLLVDQGVVAMPLAINHIDHEVTTNLALHVLSTMPVAGRRILLWEDLPSRVLNPQLIQPRLDFLASMGWKLSLTSVGRGDIYAKEIAVSCYRSQLKELDWRSSLVPERIWQATP